MNQTPRQKLDAAARTRVPDDINLYPRLAAQLERKTLMQTLRARPAFAVLIVLIALSALTGVAYAVGRTLGYIPGFGMVERGASLRVLAEPVTVTRDDITLTVKSAVLSPEKTVIVFTLENVPQSAYSHKEDAPGCANWPQVRLPDGNVLQIQNGDGIMNETRVTYTSIPASVNDVIFVLPCISDTQLGLAPENWELPLRFIPAPPDMTVIPVVDIAPTTAPVKIAPVDAAAEIVPTVTSVGPEPVFITQALQVGEETVIIGDLRQPGNGGWLELRDGPRLTDANGQEVSTSSPEMDGLPSHDWGLQFQTNDTYPLTLAFQGVQIAPIAGSVAEFEFDAGENPQPQQVWTLNLPIQIGGRTITLLNIQADGQNGYYFSFQADPDITGLSLEIVGYTFGGFGGGGSGEGGFSIGRNYETLPKGKLIVRLSDLTVASPLQTWTLQWSPENAP